jgi:uncharacterized protein
MKFVCDASLGRLARYLRLLGLDAVYIKKGEQVEAYKDEKEEPFFLTRGRSPVRYSKTVHITSNEVMDQLSEIRDLIRPLLHWEKALKRCLVCNRELLPAGKDEIEHLVPEFVFHHCDRFMVCPACSKVYWEGSHVQNMQRLVKEVIG